MINPEIKLITILGPTASGKTDLAIGLAERFNGEIVCADSRTIYRGMDIGTAKPTIQEQACVPHHLLDVVDPGERLSAGAFKTLAEAAINGIGSRGRVPFLVGGSGLYIDAVLFDYQFPEEADPERRARFEAMTDQELRELLAAEDPEAYERVDLANRRRLIRAIETAGQERARLNTVRPRTLVLGMVLNKEIVQRRVELRIEKMLEKGLFEEVQKISAQYGDDSEALNVIGYKEFKEVLSGAKSMDQARADLVRSHMMLIKKQQTWFKRNAEIVWLEDVREAEKLVRDFLQSDKV